MMFQYYWDTRKFNEVKYVGTTNQLKANGTVRKSKNAGVGGMKFSHHVASATYARVRLNHDVKNPLCSASGPISYYAIVDVKKDRSYTVYGSAVPVPNHEILVRNMSGTNWRIIRRKKAASFHCLSVGFGCPANQAIAESGTYRK